MHLDELCALHSPLQPASAANRTQQARATSALHNDLWVLVVLCMRNLNRLTNTLHRRNDVQLFWQSRLVGQEAQSRLKQEGQAIATGT